MSTSQTAQDIIREEKGWVGGRVNAVRWRQKEEAGERRENKGVREKEKYRANSSGE